MRRITLGLLSLSFVAFTQLNGQPVWIVPAQVIAVLAEPIGNCKASAGAYIVTTATGVCVHEEASEVVKKLEGK